MCNPHFYTPCTSTRHFDTSFRHVTSSRQFHPKVTPFQPQSSSLQQKYLTSTRHFDTNCHVDRSFRQKKTLYKNWKWRVESDGVVLKGQVEVRDFGRLKRVTFMWKWRVQVTDMWKRGVPLINIVKKFKIFFKSFPLNLCEKLRAPAFLKLSGRLVAWLFSRRLRSELPTIATLRINLDSNSGVPSQSQSLIKMSFLKLKN